MQELRLTNTTVDLDVDSDSQLSAISGPRTGGSPGALAHLECLTMLVTADVRTRSFAKWDMLQQLAVLAPQTERLTALTLSGWGVLDRSRSAKLAESLRLLPTLSDLQVHSSAEDTVHVRTW